MTSHYWLLVIGFLAALILESVFPGIKRRIVSSIEGCPLSEFDDSADTFDPLDYPTPSGTGEPREIK